MRLADQILALHSEIHEVSIIEERVGHYAIVDEASRKGVTFLADITHSERTQGLLAPMILLGAATQFGGRESRLIGIEYENAALVIAPLTDKKLVLLSTRLESAPDVMRTISQTPLTKLEQFPEQTP